VTAGRRAGSYRDARAEAVQALCAAADAGLEPGEVFEDELEEIFHRSTGMLDLLNGAGADIASIKFPGGR
jgi:hypothetical protein